MRDIWETFAPPLRAAAITAFVAGLAWIVLNPPSFGGLGDLIAILAGATAIAILTGWATVALIGKEMPEPDFRRLVDRSELLAFASAVAPTPNRRWTSSRRSSARC